MNKHLALTISLCLLLTACPGKAEHKPRRNVWHTAKHVLRSLEGKNMAKLAKLAHPEKGIRFTPFTYVEPERDVVLTAAQIRTALDENEVINWGPMDATEEVLQLPFAQYYLDYVWDHNYLEAPQVFWNQRMDHGSMIDNARAVYETGQIVEYHFPGFDETYGGLDWVSLRLVLEQYKQRWYLVGIIHDRWSP